MPELLLATRNARKAREIFQIVRKRVPVVFSESFPEFPETREDQPTIEGNAIKKAVQAALSSKRWSLADDTALEVEALDGAPGAFSARYAGDHCSCSDNVQKLLKALARTPLKKRRAVFRTVMALADRRGNVRITEGRLKGVIAEHPAGSRGFGYDPVFFVPSAGKTLGEMSAEEKNTVSHRARALKKMLPHIKKVLAAALLVGFFPPARAERASPGDETVWDQIMAGQAAQSEYVGSVYLHDGHYEAAAREFGRAVAANPRDPNAHMMLGVAYYWTGQVEKSLEEYQKSLALDSNNAQVRMLIGISLAWQGNVQGAYAEFKTAAKLDPTRSDVQMNLGSVEESLGLIPQALDQLRNAASLSPKDALYHYQLGMLYRRLGRYAEATGELKAALGIFPDYEDALLEMGSIAEKDHEIGQALEDYERAVDLKSRDAVARFLLAHLYLEKGQTKNARGILARAFNLTPKEGGTGLQLSVAYAGRKPESKRPRQENGPQPRQNPDSESNSAAGSSKNQKPEDPVDVFKKNLERIPLSQSAIMQIEVVFTPRPKLRRVDEEDSSALKKALARELGAGQAAPQAVEREYPIHAGDPAERRDEIRRIIGDLKKTLAQAPPDTDIRFGMNLTYKNLAQASTGGSHPEKNPLNVSYQPHEVGNDLGLWIMGSGWTDLVKQIVPRPGEGVNHPDQTDWWTDEGLGYATLGKGPEALAAFERACRLDPSNPVAWLGRAVASVILGDEKGAVKDLRQVLAIDPNNRKAKEGLKWLLTPPQKRVRP